MIALSKLLITGGITSNTPKVVINDILFTHDVDSIKDLSKLKVVKVSKEPRDEDYEDIAEFLNPHEQWQESKLIKAWLFIQEFMNSRISVKWNLEHTGLQTNEHPYSLNVCMLYRICLEWSLPLKVDTTTKHMINMIRISLVAPKELRVFICSKIRTNYDDAKDNETTINRLSLIKDKLVGLREPSTNCEAIALSAYIYKKDITYSKYPIVDYYSKTQLSKYNDPVLLNIIKKNPKIIDLSETFNPLFPIEYYSRYDLKKFSERVGFTDILLNAAMYSNLQLSYITENFHNGWQLNMIRDTTYVSWYNVDERKDLICFGDHISGFTPFVPEELEQMFNYYKSFIHPVNTEEELPERLVTTLQIIATNHYPSLASVIRKIKLADSLGDKDYRDLSRWSLKLSQQEIIYVRNLLTKILELGMYCRGWKGDKDPWPLKKRPYEEEITDGLVTVAFWPVYEEYSNKLGKKLLDLPMYKYFFGTWKKVIDPKDGLSLYERIKMIKENPNVYACIRMSSNILVYTAYKYMIEFGMPEPFNINNVDHIC